MRKQTRTLVLLAMLAAVSTVLRLLQVPVPFAPAFMRLDVSDLPVVLGGFALGPWAAIGIAYVKNFIALLFTETAGVGELGNFLMAIALAVPAAIMYRRKPSTKQAAYALVFGVVAMTLMAMAFNHFIMLPFFALMTGVTPEQIVAMFGAVNPWVTTRFELILFTITPFNLIKGTLTAGLSFLLYKRTVTELRRFTGET